MLRESFEFVCHLDVWRQGDDPVEGGMDCLLLLLMVLLLSQGNAEKLKTNCYLTLEQQRGVKPWNHYSPGDHLISVILSATHALYKSFHFSEMPFVQPIV